MVKTCPMLEVQCWRERCSWWDEEETDCAVAGLTKTNRRLEKLLTVALTKAPTDKKSSPKGLQSTYKGSISK